MTVQWNGLDRDLDPTFVGLINARLGPLPYVYGAVQGWRSDAYQHSLYLQGRNPDTLQVVDPSKVVTSTDDSAHESGLAADFAIIDGGKIVWTSSHPGYAAKKAAIDQDQRLKDGWYIVLPSGRDVGHVEMRNWRTLVPKFPADPVSFPSFPVGGDGGALRRQMQDLVAPHPRQREPVG